MVSGRVEAWWEMLLKQPPKPQILWSGNPHYQVQLLTNDSPSSLGLLDTFLKDLLMAYCLAMAIYV